MLGLYALGFLAAVGTARALKSSVLTKERMPFVLEMPPYRWPTARQIGLRLLDRAKIFLRRAGTVILAVAIGLWVLAHVPLRDGVAPPIGQSVAGTVGHAVEPLIAPLGFDWKIGVGRHPRSPPAKVIVGLLGTLYGIEGTPTRRGLEELRRT
jgi:ferrous iron transport protein B